MNKENTGIFQNFSVSYKGEPDLRTGSGQNVTAPTGSGSATLHKNKDKCTNI